MVTTLDVGNVNLGTQENTDLGFLINLRIQALNISTVLHWINIKKNYTTKIMYALSVKLKFQVETKNLSL